MTTWARSWDTTAARWNASMPSQKARAMKVWLPSGTVTARGCWAMRS